MSTHPRQPAEDPSADTRTDLDQRLSDDLAALARATQHTMPPWSSIRSVIARAEQRSHAVDLGGLGHSTDTLKGAASMQKVPVFVAWLQRPRTWLGAAGSVALAGAVLLWPIEYERTVGHSVQLDVQLSAPSHADDPPSQLPTRVLAKQIKAALHAESVRVELRQHEGQMRLSFLAKVPTRTRSEVDTQTAVLLRELESQHASSPMHPTFHAQVSERREQVSGRVYAMALDRLIQVRVDTHGKTDAEVQAEVERQLRAQGITSPTVHFERHGDEKKLTIEADTGDRAIQVLRKSDGADPVMEVTVGDIDSRREPGMTDDQLKEKILRQLAAKGLTGTVTVRGDQVEIRAQRHATP